MGFVKKVLICMAMCVGCVYALDPQLVALVNEYKKNGIGSIESKLEGYLTSKEYWAEYLKGNATEYGYFEDLKFLFVSNKSAPSLHLYQFKDSVLHELGSSSALVAKGKGNKKKEGDLTTPIGSYDLNARLTGLDQYYGPLAFSTSYPNVYDQSLKKTGGGIWIHGLPLNGNREELNTRGCIAIDNELLKKYDRLIDWKKTMLITYEGELKPADVDELALVLSSLYQWKNAWQKSDLTSYLAFYDEKDFYRPDGMSFKSFREHKKNIFAKNEDKVIRISLVNVLIYPNEAHRNMYRISFMQDYKATLKGKPSFSSVGKKDMYVVVENGKMKILSER
ncbi:L,D-transpeptidase Cds6 family protein [Helicobacter labetoulli]|uniref:L,D-transpeptidase Cds6 family protein n=1 Tax=Helicobacter labetoulli TaxID=2315333 RepID=UPI000EF7420D|nr:L,D-transpeptidase family protein [Helicobacter labetoulli]